MFTRNVTMKLKSNRALPLLRKQPGFRDVITFVAPERSEALSISFWDTKENCETYIKNAYPEALKLVGKLVEGTPKVETFVLSTSTLHKRAAKA